MKAQRYIWNCTVLVSVLGTKPAEEAVDIQLNYVNNAFHSDQFDFVYQSQPSRDEKYLVEACRKHAILVSF